MTHATVIAKDHADTQTTAEEMGLLLAETALAELGRFERVEISLYGLRGVSSTFFNALLGRVVEVAGPGVLDSRLVFLCETQTQRDVLQRSLEAIAT